MHELGLTRSVHRHDHILLTPDTFVRAPLPGMIKATAIVHVAPARGAGFMQYTAELEPGGLMPSASRQRFVYVLDGTIDLESGNQLCAGGYAYFPEGSANCISSSAAAKIAVIEKAYESLPGTPPPEFFTGNEDNIPPQPLMGDPSIELRILVPAEPSFDFAVNTMSYQPGSSLPMVEIHVMEHGLLMLEGGGIYRLNDQWYPVSAGDFIWMAPYCPQWFAAVGKDTAKYLIYKDWNRNPGA